MIKTKQQLKAEFETGDIITEQAMVDLIDSLLDGSSTLNGVNLSADSVDESKLAQTVKAKLKADNVQVDDVTIEKAANGKLQIKLQAVGTSQIKDDNVTEAKLATSEKSTTILNTVRGGVNTSYNDLKKLYDYTNAQFHKQVDSEIIEVWSNKTLLPGKIYATRLDVLNSAITLTLADGRQAGDTIVIYIIDARSDIKLVGSDGKKPSENGKIHNRYRSGSRNFPDKINGFSKYTVLRAYWDTTGKDQWVMHRIANPIVGDGSTIGTIQSGENLAFNLMNDAVTAAKIDNSAFATTREAKGATLTKKIINPKTLGDVITGHTNALLNGATSNYNTFGKIENLIETNIANISHNNTEINTLKALGSIKYTVADITARNSLTGLKTGDLVFVTDATTDATVNRGWAIYRYSTTRPNWLKIAENESLDVVSQVLVDDATIDKDGKQQIQVKDDGLSTAKYKNLSVTAPKLADDAVVTRVIKDEAVTEDKLSKDVKRHLGGSAPHQYRHYDWHRDIDQDNHGDMIPQGINFYSHFNWYALAGNWAYGEHLSLNEGLHAGYIDSTRNTTVEFIFYFDKSKYSNANLISDASHNNKKVLQLDHSSGKTVQINLGIHKTISRGYEVESLEARQVFDNTAYIVRVQFNVSISDNSQFKLRLTNDSPTNQPFTIPKDDMGLSIIQYPGNPSSPSPTYIPLFYQQYLTMGNIEENAYSKNKSKTDVPSMYAFDKLVNTSPIITSGYFASGDRRSGEYQINVTTSKTGVNSNLFTISKQDATRLVNGVSLKEGDSIGESDKVFFNGQTIVGKYLLFDFSQADTFKSGGYFENYDLVLTKMMITGNHNTAQGTWKIQRRLSDGSYTDTNYTSVALTLNSWIVFNNGMLDTRGLKMVGVSGNSNTYPWLGDVIFHYYFRLK